MTNLTVEAADTESGGTASDQPRRTGKGHVDSYGQGRVCAAPDCATELSRYNPSSACWLHDETVMPVAHWTH